MTKPRENKRIGEILVEKGLITQEQLNSALRVHKERKEYLCTTIIRLGFAKAQDVFKVLSRHLGVYYIDFKKEAVDPEAVSKVAPKLALHYKLMPFKIENNKLFIALADPLDIKKLDDLKLLIDMDIEPVLAFEEDIVESIQKYYGVGAETLQEIISRKGMAEDVQTEAAGIQDLETVVEDASIIKFVNQIFTQAVEERATDIHLEPFEDELRVRFRIDGFLYEVPIPESIRLFSQAIVSRIKIMANLDIAEHRLSQDGRIKIKVRKSDLDLRVSILPSAFGESVQIRILRAHSFLSLEQLGLFDDDLQKINALINAPYGIVFVTGPTGSGKSTTLYAALSKKNLPNIKIVTTEDPIEYQMRGITQIQVNPKIGLTFAEVLRCILRHDPDIIMVGEARDRETAEITIRSAMTGHLVFSTLHTNDAASSPMRLIDMKAEPFLVASSVEGIIAQRLVRVICADCKKKTSVSSDIFRQAGVEVKGQTQELYEGVGCEACRFTGFKGRTAIFEIMVMNQVLRDLIFKQVTSQAIKEEAVKNGMRTLRQDGLRKVLQGITTLGEVMRVT